MSDDATNDAITKAVGAGGVGFGLAALLAPDLLAQMYGFPAATPSFRYMGRLWGTALGAVGMLSLTASTDAERKRLAMIGTVVNVIDTVVAFTASGLPARARVQAGLTSAGFAAASAKVLSSS
jgi:hypothetical protein